MHLIQLVTPWELYFSAHYEIGRIQASLVEQLAAWFYVLCQWLD